MTDKHELLSYDPDQPDWWHQLEVEHGGRMYQVRVPLAYDHGVERIVRVDDGGDLLYLIGEVGHDVADLGRTGCLIVARPLEDRTYLAYWMAMPMLVSVVMTLAVFPLAGLVRVGLVPLVLMALGAAPLAPLFALFLGAFADNKVEGFALMKASGVLFLPPVPAYFVGAGWQWALGLIPTYWPVKAFWVQQAGGAGYLAYLLVGLVYQALLLVPLLRRFNRVMQGWATGASRMRPEDALAGGRPRPCSSRERRHSS